MPFHVCVARTTSAVCCVCENWYHLPCLCSLVLVLYVVFVKMGSSTCCLGSQVLVLYVVFVKTGSASCCLFSMILMLYVVCVKTG